MNRFLPRSSISPKSIFSNSNRFLILGGVVLLILAIVYVIYNYLNRPKIVYNDNGTVRNSSSGSGSKDAEIILFSVDWCPHCKTAKPEWDKVKAEYNGKDVNGYHLVFTDINCTNESPQVEKLMNQYKIEGYPTIKLIKDGQVIEFDAKPTESNLKQYIQTVL